MSRSSERARRTEQMFMSGMGHGIDVAQYLTVPEGRALRATNSTMLKAVDKNRDLYKEVFTYIPVDLLFKPNFLSREIN